MSELFSYIASSSPLLVTVPHAGTAVPGGIRERLSPHGQALEDTDWFVDRLYEWVPELGAGLLVANYSRYVVDLNRPPDDSALYRVPTPGLVPFETFSGQAIYQAGKPDDRESKQRVKRYWQPFHEQLRRELDRIRSRFGHAILLDAHSIRSRVPQLFEGRLPDMNLGTYDGRSADPTLVRLVGSKLSGQKRYTSVIDGRFKGGYITRHHGHPADGVHAMQMEMAQAIYMQESPPVYEAERACELQVFLRQLLISVRDWRPGA